MKLYIYYRNFEEEKRPRLTFVRAWGTVYEGSSAPFFSLYVLVFYGEFALIVACCFAGFFLGHMFCGPDGLRRIRVCIAYSEAHLSNSASNN
jgi:hypothetical protein